MDYNEVFNFFGAEDVLIIKKEGHLLSHDELVQEGRFKWDIFDEITEDGKVFTNYGVNMQMGKSCWNDKDNNLLYNGTEFYCLSDAFQRLNYIYASIHEESKINEMVMKHIPEISQLTVPLIRGTKQPFLVGWMEKYNFTLEDFWLNTKYVVLSDNPYRNNVFRHLFCDGLLDLDKIEAISTVENI